MPCQPSSTRLAGRSALDDSTRNGEPLEAAAAAATCASSSPFSDTCTRDTTAEPYESTLPTRYSPEPVAPQLRAATHCSSLCAL